MMENVEVLGERDEESQSEVLMVKKMKNVNQRS